MKTDFHLLKYFSAFVAVSEGRVLYVTPPGIRYCSLACSLYGNPKTESVFERQAFVRKVIESKIQEFGFFTRQRQLLSSASAIPFGASEMLASGLRKNTLDTVVLVCDGAGSIMTSNPDLVQGIGARMHALFYTTPISAIIERLESLGAVVLSREAVIDQVASVRKAMECGFKRIGVTLAGAMSDDLRKIREMEKEHHARVFILSVCTNGVTLDQIQKINACADLVWSCSSSALTHQTGPRARLQLSQGQPVFALTDAGIELAMSAAESHQGRIWNKNTQYLIASQGDGEPICFGGYRGVLRPASLPSLRENKFRK